MAYSEKEIQYVVSKYPSEFFDFTIEIIAAEVTLPNRPSETKYSVDILAQDKNGYIVIELKTKKFDIKALTQLQKYSKRISDNWGKVSKIIGMSPKGSKIKRSNGFIFIEISDRQIENIQKKYNINFNNLLTNSESLARDSLMVILKNASINQLNTLFSKTRYLYKWEKLDRTNYQAIFKNKPIKVTSDFHTVFSQNQGIDIVAHNKVNNFEFELKVRTKLRKDQLLKYKQKSNSRLLFLVSNNLRHYYDQLLISQAYHLSWDHIYDVSKEFSFLTEENLNNLNRYRYHFYQKVADFLYEEAFNMLKDLKKPEFEKIDKDINNKDMEYYFLFYRINKDFGPISKILKFVIGMHCDTCDRIAVRILSPEKYFKGYPKMKIFYETYLFKEHLNLSGMEISKHPFYSFDVSHIRSINDITKKEINDFVQHIIKTTNKYCEVLEQIV